MDISINVEDYKLNVRAAAIIIHNNKILVHKNIHEDYYALLGGRVQIGEDSETTIKREILEELGKKIEITGYISTIENLFHNQDKKFHEIMFVYKAEFKNEEDKKIEHTIKNIEGEDYLRYEWLELNNIDEHIIKPEKIKSILKNGKFPIHQINKEI